MSEISLFIASKLSLNFDKTNFIKFVTSNKPVPNMHVSCYGKYIREVKNKIPWSVNL